MTGRRGLGCLPRPKLQPGAIHALLWMLYMAEVTQYGLPHQLTAGHTDKCGDVMPDITNHRPVCIKPTGHRMPHQSAPPVYCWAPVLPLPPMPSCTCRYRVHTTSVVLTVRRRPLRQLLVTGTGFEIDPACEHHGDLRRVEYFDATYTDVLDESERRGY